MGTHTNRTAISVLALISLLVASLLSACTQTQSLSKEQAEKELVAFMLDFTLHQELGVTGVTAQSGRHLWANAPPDASLIVWAPPVTNLDDATTIFVNTDEPSRVWWYAGNQLVEVTDKVEAIQAFRQVHFSGSSPSKGWGYYEFGLFSLSDGNRTAKVYLGVSCGPLCGEGTIYTLQRDDSGEWKITKTEPRWIS
jgi:hypothetical protein